MHIFPFAETAGEVTAAAGTSKAKTSFYPLSIIPQEGFHGKLASKDPRSGGPAPVDGSPSVTFELIWHTALPANFNQRYPLGKASKFFLTSCSDRSPPRFL